MYPHGHNLDQPPYPGNSFPMAPPPRKTRWGLITASLAAAFALSVGGAYAYDHLIVKGESTAASSSSSSGPPISVLPESGIGTGNQSASPTKPTLGEGFSPREQEYVDRLGNSGVVVHTPALAVHDGHDACGAITESGSFLDGIKLMERYNADMGEIGALVTSVVAVQTLCPENSPLGTSTTTGNPVPAGQDGEFITRLQDVGLSVDNQSDAIGDGHKVCTVMDQAPSNKFLGAAQMLVDANPRMGKPAAIFMTVIALQVYCPPRD
jgi:hypothetical protein